MNLILLGGIAGAAAGGILLFLSHIAPRFGAGAFVRDLDAVRVFGREISRREAHALGMFLHLALSFVFGALYAFGVSQGIASGYRAVPLAAYAGLITLFAGGVVMPLEGHGLFGWKEDSWFVVDLFITNVLWTALYALVVTAWV
jgi:hypothetical protein